MPPVSGAKPRAQRIPLNYFKKPDQIARSKRLLAGLALGLVLLWLAAGLFFGERSNERYSHGELAAKHQHLDTNCAACHIDFSPISLKAWNAPLGSPFSRDPKHVQVLAADARCQECHPFNTLAEIHHGNQKLESLSSCGSCHREHRGRNAALTQVVDSDCTSCHRDLDANRTAESIYVDRRTDRDRLANRITGFSRPEEGHPDFRASSQPDPGVIKFNHKVHTTPGIVYAAGARPWTLGDVKAIDQDAFKRYAQLQQTTDEKAAVKLDCAACHEPGDQGFQTWRPSQGEAAYMQPIRYERHCKGCHPLRFDDSPEFREAVVPHGLQPAEVVRSVRGAYAAQTGKRPAPSPAPAVPLPGKLPTATVPDQEAMVALALRTLFVGKKTCGECHEYARHEDGQLEVLPGDPTGVVPAGLLTGRPSKPAAMLWHTSTTAIPEVWFSHARFNHKSHRTRSDGTAIDCRECHANAYGRLRDGADNPSASQDHKDVLLPTIDNCRQCHAPRGTLGGQASGGSRYDCAECHNFHHADDPAGRQAGVKGAVGP
jgi:hypothetical protein